MNQPTTQGSIRSRLLISLLVGAAILAIAIYLVVQSVARQIAQESQDNVLVASALSILDSTRYSGGQINVDLPYSALSMLDSVSDERVFYAIWLDKEFLTGYRALPRAEEASIDAPGFMSISFLGEDVRIVTVKRAISTDVGYELLEVSVAQTLSGQKQTLTGISRSSMAIGAGFFVLCVFLAAAIARSTIRPLDRLTASVSRRGPNDLRPVAAPVPSEMVPLVASLNDFMSRLEKSLSQSEEFIAEAAHRVRTPLAIVRTKAEIIQRKLNQPANRAAMREMIHAIDDSSRTAGQLLDHAMVNFRLDYLADDEIDLPRLVQDSVDRLRPTSELKDIELTATRMDDVTIKGDAILLSNALYNLLDNAVKYAPAEATVRVSLIEEAGAVRLCVKDSGPGFPTEELDHLTERFARGTNAKDVAGSGLGLAIVRQVVEAHGGRIEIGNNPGGGACVTLFFPLS